MISFVVDQLEIMSKQNKSFEIVQAKYFNKDKVKQHIQLKMYIPIAFKLIIQLILDYELLSYTEKRKKINKDRFIHTYISSDIQIIYN